MTRSKHNEVVLTGLGILAPNGTGKDAFWQNLLEGRSGIGTITLFDASSWPCQIAGEVKNFHINDYVPGIKAARHGRHTLLGLAALELCLQDAGLKDEDFSRHAEVGLYAGVSSSALDELAHGQVRLLKRGPDQVSPFLVQSTQPHAVATLLASYVDNLRLLRTYSSACSAGMDSIVGAYRDLREGVIDMAIVGGADAPITPLTMAAFSSARMVGQWSGDPAQASRPFDNQRTGGVLAEGACFMTLETREHAERRSAAPYLRLSGYGIGSTQSADSFQSSITNTMCDALANACIYPDEVDYISAHGPGDMELDRLETQAIKCAFGGHAYRVPISSIKGVTGNPLSAAAPLQLAACGLAMRHNLIPPTANYEYPDPICDLDYVPQKARHAHIRNALINARGMGGGLHSLVTTNLNYDQRT